MPSNASIIAFRNNLKKKGSLYVTIYKKSAAPMAILIKIW